MFVSCAMCVNIMCCISVVGVSVWWVFQCGVGVSVWWVFQCGGCFSVVGVSVWWVFQCGGCFSVVGVSVSSVLHLSFVSAHQFTELN